MFYIWGFALATIAVIVLLGVIVYVAVKKHDVAVRVTFWPPSVEITGRGPPG